MLPSASRLRLSITIHHCAVLFCFHSVFLIGQVDDAPASFAYSPPSRYDEKLDSLLFSNPPCSAVSSSFFLSFFILSNINTISQIRFHEPTDSRACYSRRRPTKSPHHVPGQQPIHFPLGNNSWQVHYYKCRIYYRVPGLLLHSDFVCSAIVRLFLPVSLSLFSFST